MQPHPGPTVPSHEPLDRHSRHRSPTGSSDARHSDDRHRRAASLLVVLATALGLGVNPTAAVTIGTVILGTAAVLVGPVIATVAGLETVRWYVEYRAGDRSVDPGGQS